MIKFKIKYVKFSLATYLSEWMGDYGTEEWAEASCPFCGTKCAVFLRDTAGRPDAVRFTGNIGLMNDIEGCEHIYGVTKDFLVFREPGRAEISPYKRY
ncbi:hypothetical protein DRJ17_05750 [Candidatus Woesearchaeota archaeon]|nr:MAG: hypothetical protein DRJ17_05750 [Candidatus Woesearchaeota archaeon]